MTKFERITAADVAVGDMITESRGKPAHEVVDLAPGERAVYITLKNWSGGTYRIRPQFKRKLWRAIPTPSDLGREVVA